MKRKLLLLSSLLMVMLFIVGCGTEDTSITVPRAPDVAKTLADNLGIPCVSTEELSNNAAYYTDGCIVYGTVTRVSFDDFSEDSIHYKDYMDEMRQTLEKDSTPSIEELMLAMETKIKNTYSYMLYMDGRDYNIYSALRYETPSSEAILDIAAGDLIYAHVKPEKSSSISDNYYLNVETLTVYDKTNRDESTKPVASEKNAEPTSSASSSSSSTNNATAESGKLEDVSYSEPFFAVSGSGDDVVDGFTADYLCYVHVERPGSKHFSVKAHHGSAYELLANTTEENFSGDFFVGSGEAYTFEVNATGDWKIEAYYIGTSSSDAFSGKGNVVTAITNSTSDAYRIESSGAGHFSVKVYYQNKLFGLTYDLLVNTTDKDYSGTVMSKTKGGQVFFVIEGERDWSITPKE